jgi:hypothetical protein
MDPITNKIVSTVSTGGERANPGEGVRQLAKVEPSKFDRVRERSGSIAASGASRQPAEVLADDIKTNGTKLHELTKHASALPKTPAFDSIRSRLAELDSQYRRLGGSIDRIPESASPQQLLKLQKDIYQMSEGTGLVSKMIDQLAGGVKSIQQMQI